MWLVVDYISITDFKNHETCSLIYLDLTEQAIYIGEQAI